MVSYTFRAQLSTDKITKVSEEWGDSCGAYQVAYGFDAEGNEIALCNNGFSQWPNYVRNVKTDAEIKADKIHTLIMKRESQIMIWASMNTLRGRLMVRAIKQRILNLQDKLYSIY